MHKSKPKEEKIMLKHDVDGQCQGLNQKSYKIRNHLKPFTVRRLLLAKQPARC